MTVSDTNMKWSNLKEYKCPKCGKDLKKEDKLISCTYCDFKIKESRYNEIVKSQFNRNSEPQVDWEELEENDDKEFE